MTNLPPDLASFAQLLDAQPEPVRSAFHHCLALLMVEAGKAKLIETRPGEPVPADRLGAGLGLVVLSGPKE